MQGQCRNVSDIQQPPAAKLAKPSQQHLSTTNKHQQKKKQKPKKTKKPKKPKKIKKIKKPKTNNYN